MVMLRSQGGVPVRQYVTRLVSVSADQLRPCSEAGSRYFSTAKDQKDDKAASTTKKQEPATVGTDGGMLGKRSGPSKDASPVSKKDEAQDQMEEDVVKGKDAKKGTETAPWAS